MGGEFTSSHKRRLAVSLLLTGLVLRAAIPAGYMPGNLLAGEFMVLCPTGLPQPVLEALVGHHAHHDDATVDVDRECPIGSALTPVWIGNDWLYDAEIDSAATFVPALPGGIVIPASFTTYQQRAPPRV